MRHYDIRNRDLFSLGPHLLGLIFIAVGTFTVLSPLFLVDSNSAFQAISAGAGYIIFGFLVLISYTGTQIDFTNSQAKTYYSICGFRLGRWKRLPAVKIVKVTLESSPARTETTDTRISLYDHQNNLVLKIERLSAERAVRDAKLIGKNLKPEAAVEIASNY